MNILCLLPLPPPVTGQSIASELLLENLTARHEVEVVDLGPGSKHDGSVSWRRVAEVLKAIHQARRGRHADAIYITIAESPAGNLKDLLIYLTTRKRSARTVAHLHGGSLERLLFRRFPPLRWFNAFFFRRFAGVVVTGAAHIGIFTPYVARERIHVVPNFAPDELFADQSAIERRFAATQPLRLLYMSGMTPAKGCFDLLAGYRLLDPALRSRITLDFAGRFDRQIEHDSFLQEIEGLPGVSYHGVVGGEHRRRLFAQSHLLCLPSSMWEGQPLAILEGFASGCVVIASGQPGIRDVFEDGINGFETKAGSIESIAAALTRALSADELATLALRNRRQAERYRQDRYAAELEAILEAAAMR